MNNKAEYLAVEYCTAWGTALEEFKYAADVEALFIDFWLDNIVEIRELNVSAFQKMIDSGLII